MSVPSFKFRFARFCVCKVTVKTFTGRDAYLDNDTFTGSRGCLIAASAVIFCERNFQNANSGLIKCNLTSKIP